MADEPRNSMSEPQTPRPKAGAGNPSKKLSLPREIIKLCSNLFWTWLGFDALADDFESHENTVRKAKSIVFLLIVALVAGVGGCWLRGLQDSSEIQSLQANVRSNEIVRASYVAVGESYKEHIADLQRQLTQIESERDQSAMAIKKRIRLLCKEMLDFQQQEQSERRNLFDYFATMRLTNREEQQIAWGENQKKEMDYYSKKQVEFQLRFFGRIGNARDQLAGLGLQSTNLNNSVDVFHLTDYRIDLITRELQRLADKITDH